MSNYSTGNVGKEMGAVPFGTIISSVALGIAEGQWALDKSSIRVTELMSGQRLLRDIDTGQLLTKAGDNLPDGAEPQVIDSRVYFGYDYLNEPANPNDFELDLLESGPNTGGIQAIKLKAGGNYGKDYAYKPKVVIEGFPGFEEEETATGWAEIDDAGSIKNIEISNKGKGYTKGKIALRFEGGGGRRTPRKLSMMELGFTPNFYQFVDTIIEIKITVNMIESESQSKTQTERSTTVNSKSTEYSSQGYGWSWYRPHSSSYKRKETSIVAKSVDPAMSSKYSYSVEGSSLVRTKMVPVPPPTILEERIRLLMETEEMYRNARLAAGNETQ